jgi:xanthine dehydrogenase YagR molybdenum-binding subunit
MAVTGKPIDRIDGRLKVTGTATYAAEFNQPRMAYAFPVRATIATGTITSFDTSLAATSSGVIAVLTHQNAPRLQPLDLAAIQKTGGAMGENLVPLQDDRVHYFGQFVALVVAETYEQARCAAALLKVTYADKQPVVDLKSELANGFYPEKSLQEAGQTNAGKAAAPLAAAPVQIERTYTTPTEHHHPMESHAIVAVWAAADKLTVYNSTQSVMGLRGILAYFFKLKPENVRVISPYVGGAFGAKGEPWTHDLLAVMAGQVVNRPVKLAITRQMMQTNVGRRSETIQTIAFGSDRQGKLLAIRHHSDVAANLHEYFETSGIQTGVLYSAPIREITHRVVKLNIATPSHMRAPGESVGSFALESAIDEMAAELNLDPLEFRILNHTAIDPLQNLPFSSEYLRECYQMGAEKFGWSRRKMQPRANRQGRQLIGYGMATATYPAHRSSASARIQMLSDGAVKVMSATQDLGTGTYTILAQTAADALGVPIEKITVEIGDSRLPPAPSSFSAQTTASVNPAVLAAGELLRNELLQLAVTDTRSNLHDRPLAEISFANAGFFVKGDPSLADSYAEIMRRNQKPMLEACATTMPISRNLMGASCQLAPTASAENSDDRKYSFHSFGAQFVEVWVDEDLGTIRVKRLVSVHDVGRVMNEKTARSQIVGGAIFGIGQALMEETLYDRRWANPVTRTLADYHIPVHLDVPEIDVYFIGKPDPHISPIGARGAGEIGIVGVAAAVANAVFNATGKRLRDLPLTPDKLL